MQLRNITLLTSSMVALAQVASAQGLYIDGGYSAVSTDIEFDDADLDETFDFGFGLVGGHAGYTFSPYFGVELEALIGVQDDTITQSIDDVDVDLTFDLKQVLGAYARGNLPLGEQFTVFGRAGIVTAEIEGSTNVEGVEAESDSEEAVAIGLGAEFDFTDQIYVRGDFTRYEFEEDGLDAFMASVGFRF